MSRNRRGLDGLFSDDAFYVSVFENYFSFGLAPYFMVQDACHSKGKSCLSGCTVPGNKKQFSLSNLKVNLFQDRVFSCSVGI